ncbi:mating type pheromone [Fomitopsis schrenkii]|uniref:Mating type pheromone n=1 Tax=Fomitopsis schrenkii TaxID=2126942 RepID=S8E2B9_FOMSC|nr:mating type pheromone [Fomitopsis schrenkii]
MDAFSSLSLEPDVAVVVPSESSEAHADVTDILLVDYEHGNSSSSFWCTIA